MSITTEKLSSGDLPSPEDEEKIITRYGVTGGMPTISPVIHEQDILAGRKAIRTSVHVEPSIVHKIQQILNQTRPERTDLESVKQLVQRGGGASPRAGLSI